MAILDPGFNLKLRPLKYKNFDESFRKAIANGWRVEEIEFTRDIVDLRTRMDKGQQHLVKRLVTFFATGDSLVANNVATVLCRHVNAPEARMYLLRQGFEEALHVQFYVTLLDSYVEDEAERSAMFDAVRNVPSVSTKAAFCSGYMDGMFGIHELRTIDDRRQFLMNLLAFAAGVEGMFFYAAFAYVFFLRSRGFLPGLAQGTNWVFRDESAHMANAFEIVNIARSEEPDLFTPLMAQRYEEMLDAAMAAEMGFAKDTLELGVAGLSESDMATYLKYIADQRLRAMGIPSHWRVKNPFTFMDQQDVPEMANFFERRPTAYGLGTQGDFSTDADF